MSGSLIQAGSTPVAGFFTASGLGATGLTVTIDVWRLRSGVVNIGSNLNIFRLWAG